MFDKSFSGVLLSSATSPLITDCGDLGLDLSAPLSYTDLTSDGATKNTSKLDFGDPLDLSAPLSYTNIIHEYTTCSLNIPPFSGPSDVFKFDTAKGSLCITGGLLASENRKYIAEEDASSRCRRQKKLCSEGSASERGIKRKHWSEHTEHSLKRLKRLKKQHKTEHPSFLIPCPSTCVCHVGPSRIITTKRLHDTDTHLLKEVLLKNVYESLCTVELSCCEKQCFHKW